eukprot:g19800.t1
MLKFGQDKSLQTRAFQALDINGDGDLSFSEFAAGVLRVFTELLEDFGRDDQPNSPDAPSTPTHKCYCMWDVKHEDWVHDLWRFGSLLFFCTCQERFLELFRRYDLDSDGMLSRAELEKFVEKVLPLANRSVQQSPEAAISQLFGDQESISFEDSETGRREKGKRKG